MLSSSSSLWRSLGIRDQWISSGFRLTFFMMIKNVIQHLESIQFVFRFFGHLSHLPLKGV